MNVLVLGYMPSPASPVIMEHGCTVLEHSEPVNLDFLRKNKIDFAVSYRYRHIVSEPVIEFLNEKIINLHISLLPWNRGADPNLWSFLEDTPKGVTIHYIDKGLDTGDIIIQKELFFQSENETLETSYTKLNFEIIELFKQVWPLIFNDTAPRYKQQPVGSVHTLKDKEKYMYLLADKGWKTPVYFLKGKALTQSRNEDVNYDNNN